MKSLKFGLPRFPPAIMSGLRFSFRPKRVEPADDDPINDLVYHLGDSLDVSPYNGSNVDDARPDRKVVSSAEHQSLNTTISTLFERTKSETKVIVAEPPLPEIEIDEELISPTISSLPKKKGFSIGEWLTSFRRVRPNNVASTTGSGFDDVDLSDNSPLAAKRGLPFRLILLIVGGIAAAFVLGFGLYTVISRNKLSHAPVVAANVPHEKSAPVAAAPEAAPPQLKPASKPGVAGHKHGPKQHIRTMLLAEGLALRPSEVVIPAKDDAEDGAPTDSSAEDARVIATLPAQIRHLCGLQVTKVIYWNYHDGYLFCHITSKGRTSSNLLQRSAQGKFTFIGGSPGLMSADEMTSMFLVDPEAAKILLTNLHATQKPQHPRK